MVVSIEFYKMIGNLIASKREDDYWDFKQEHHANKADLIHDIICLANNRSGKDGYIIFGVSDEPKGEVCGVEQDENRRTQQQIIDLLQSQKLKWAYGVYPSVELQTIHLREHEVCKPPRWCIIEAPQWRFYYGKKETHTGRKCPQGKDQRAVADGEHRQHGRHPEPVQRDDCRVHGKRP